MTFTADLTRFAEKTGVKADQVLRKVGLEGLRQLIERSPVDTSRFKTNWRAALDRVDTTTTDGPDTSGNAAAKAVVEQAKFGQTINITNDLEYGPKLERGWSKQAPNGFLSLTHQSLAVQLDAMIKSVGP